MQDLTLHSELRSPLTLVSNSPHSNQFEEIIINGSKMFSCLTPDCGKTFKYKSEMTRHIAIHLDQRPYVCTYPGCNKTFKRNDALTNHFRIHNKKSAHICPVSTCKAEFSTKSSLRYHLLKHEGQKAFECGFPGCNQTFISQLQLKQHEKTSCIGLKVEQAASPVISSPVSQKDFTLNEYTQVNDYSTLTASNFEFNFPDFEGKFDDLMTSEEDSDRCSIPNTYNAKSEEAASTDLSEMSSLAKKSGRNLEDILISLLTYMTEENQQLKKKLKYSSDLIQGNLSEVAHTNDHSQECVSEHEQEQEQDQDRFPNIQFDQEPFNVDSFFRLEGDDNNEREFIF